VLWFLSKCSPLSLVSVGGLLAVCVATWGPVMAQDSQSLADHVSAARSKALEGKNCADPDQKRVKFKEALDLAMGALNDAANSTWDRDDHRQLLKEMGFSWIGKLSTEQQRAWLNTHGPTANSPSGRLMMAFVEWKLGSKVIALVRLGSIISGSPDSVASETAIQLILGIHYYRGDTRSFTKALNQFVDIAPNNRSSAWALSFYTWKSCQDRKPEQAYELNTRVIESKPGTLAAQAGEKLNQVMVAIEEGEFRTAVDIMAGFPEHYFRETLADQIIDTFLLNVDFRSIEKSKAALTRLMQTMTEVAESHPTRHFRHLAKCVKARVYENQRKVTQAVALLEEVLAKETGPLRPFESYTLSRIGRLLRARDPQRAIGHLERFRNSHGKSAGAEHYVMTLGRLYLKTGKPDKALEVFTWLEDRRKRGETITEKKSKTGIQLGLIASLERLGRNDEAQALAQQLLAPYGYGKDPSDLTRTQRKKLASLLASMGRGTEAARYRPK